MGLILPALPSYLFGHLYILIFFPLNFQTILLLLLIAVNLYKNVGLNMINCYVNTLNTLRNETELL